MSTQEFKPGDKVEYVGHLTPSLRGLTGTVRPFSDVDECLVDWDQPTDATRSVLSASLRLVQPEWVVGQQVSGDDYERLPVGTKAWIGGSSQVTRGPVTWVYDSGAPCVPGSTRTITHLPDATQPEDATDAYVEPVSEPSVDDSEDLTEPEPLKDWTTPIDKVMPPEDPDRVTVNTLDREELDRLIRSFPPDWSFVNEDGTIDSQVINDMQAALRKFAEPVKPARCTSLKRTVGDRAALWQCTHDAPHTDMHECGDVAWTTAEEYGRVEVSS